MLERDRVFTTLQDVLDRDGRLSYTAAVSAVFGTRLSSSSPGYAELRPLYERFVSEMSLCRAVRSRGRVVYVPRSRRRQPRQGRSRRTLSEEAMAERMDALLEREGRLTYRQAVQAVFGRDLRSGDRNYLSFASVYRRYVLSRRLAKRSDAPHCIQYVRPEAQQRPAQPSAEGAGELPPPPVPYPLVRDLFTQGLRTGCVLASDVEPPRRREVLAYLAENAPAILRRIRAPFSAVDVELRPDRLCIRPRDEVCVLVVGSRSDERGRLASVSLCARLGGRSLAEAQASVREDSGFIEPSALCAEDAVVRDALGRLVERCEALFRERGLGRAFVHVPAKDPLVPLLRERAFRHHATIRNYVGGRTWHVLSKRLS